MITPGMKEFDDLANKGWTIMEDVLELHLCNSLVDYVKSHKERLKQAAVGKGTERKLVTSIRRSKTFWINDFNISPALSEVKSRLEDLMNELAQSFYLSLKRFESQCALYENGGFYKKHLDQLRENKHRQVTCIYYLKDCSDGGELVIYNRDDKNKIDAVITPRAGTCVVFFSKQIFHEVLHCNQERISVTTWMRDDEIPVFSSLPI